VKIRPDFGAVRENAAAFDVAVASITSGDIAWGRSLLAALRDHIWSTEEQKSALTRLHCDEMQGWIFSDAVSEDHFARLLSPAGPDAAGLRPNSISL